MPSQTGAPHGEAPGSVVYDPADARSLGSHIEMLCSALAKLMRPSVWGRCRNVTVIDAAITAISRPLSVSAISSSGRVIPRSRTRAGSRVPSVVTARSDIGLHHLDES